MYYTRLTDHRLLCLWFNAILGSFLFLDEPVYLYARTLSEPVRDIFYAITDLGLSGWILVPTALVVLVAYLLRKRVRSTALKAGLADIGLIGATVFLCVGLTGTIAALLKQITGRARPKLFDTLGAHDVDLFAFAHAQASFPSGHTTTTFAFAFVVSLYMPNLKLWLYSLAVWVGVSRIVTGAHYTSDVVAGALLGTLGAYLITQKMQRMGFQITKTRHACAAVRYGYVELKKLICR